MPSEFSPQASPPGFEPVTVECLPPDRPSAPQDFPFGLGVAIVLALTFAVYSQTSGYQFVHDDRGQIVENPAVHSWHAVPGYFTSHVWEAFDPEEHGNYFRPLFLLWLRINDALFGNRAGAWHLTTILTHLLATFLVYLLVWRVGMGCEVALLAALIFGLHPAHIEAVAWISGVTEPLLGILLIASLLCYLQSRLESGRALKWQVISVGLFALALLEKETGVILPGFLLVYEWIYGPEWAQPLTVRRVLAWCGRAIRKTWPYFLVILLYLPVRIHALKGFSHIVAPLSPAQLLFTWPALIWFWIRHLLWPVGLSTFYNLPAVVHPNLRNFSLPSILDVGAVMVLVACTRRSRALAFFATWLVLPLIPVLNLRAFVADDFAHDRYLYLPSVGLAVLVAMALKKVCVGQPRWLGMPASLLVAATCLAATLSYGTITGSFYFKDNLTFYAYNLTKAPQNRYVELNYATVLGEDGKYDPALAIFTDMVTRYPDFWPSTYNLAYTNYKMGRLQDAERYFLRAIHLKPYKSDEHLYLGMTRFKLGRTGEAIAAVQQAIAIRPGGQGYHFALGVMLKTQGDLNGALREFQVELATNPGAQAAAEQVKEIENRLKADAGAEARHP
jgi:tetratricopeptide (TPR) repeat protein